MSFVAGDKLGPYEVVSRIGVGGMGEVYRAHDTRLNREVAIKISAEQFNERFDREARAVAALNHPNICTLYDVGPDYLVMEFVEGDTLKGPLPLDEALRIARQIADALEEAHAKGVVHRDLKPANIKVKPDGTVKVLDFGLAKMGGTPAVSSQDSPTISLAATQAGVILGTAAYMSPEQARGKVVDKRTDIWAFGVVFYEMLTGEQLFGGEDLTDTLAAVVRKEPDFNRVPVEVRRLIKVCLERDPKRRLREIGDAWQLLDEAPAAAVPHAASSRLPLLLAMTAAAVFAMLAAVIAFVHFRETPRPLPVVSFQIAPPPKTVLADYPPAISPDGRSVAFVARDEGGKERIWIRSLDSVAPRPMPGTEDERIGGVFWSPDNRSVAFSAGGVLKRVGVDGGPPLTLANTSASTPGSWNSDGVILVGSPRGILRIPQSGGAAELVTHTDAPRESVHVFPHFLPDGRHFLYSAFEAGGGTIYLATLDGLEKKLLVEGVSSAAYSAPRAAGELAYVLYLRDTTLMAQPLDPDDFELAGDAFAVADGVSSAFGGGIPFFSSSSTGAIAYRTGAVFRELGLNWVDRSGTLIGSIGPTGAYVDVAISRRGNRVAVAFLDAQSIGSDIWLMDARQGGPYRFTTAPGVDATPVWSPDDARLAFSSDSGSTYGELDGYVQDLDGGQPEQVVKAGRIRDWSRDGDFLTYDDRDENGRFRLWVLPLKGDRKAILYPHDRFNEGQGQFAPELQPGPPRWIAYASDESGAYEVYVQSFPPGRKTRISVGGGMAPRWRSDGKELFYLGPNNELMSVEMSLGMDIKKGAVKELFTTRSAAGGPRGAFSFRYDVAADGNSFLIITRPENAEVASAPITVVLNWLDGTKR